MRSLLFPLGGHTPRYGSYLLLFFYPGLPGIAQVAGQSQALPHRRTILCATTLILEVKTSQTRYQTA